MDYFQAIILGILQGITEFLPISSSGHLVIAQKLFGMQKPPIFFDTLIHFGTLSAVFFYFRKEIGKLFIGAIKREKSSLRFLKIMVLATLPIAFIGFLLKDSIEVIFNSLKLIGAAYLGMAIILFATGIMNALRGPSSKQKEKPSEDVQEISLFGALFIGLFQALAILPGISRSGSTISAGIFRKIDQELIFRFSFLIAIPAIMGALALQIFDSPQVIFQDFKTGTAGFLASAIFGFLSLGFLRKVLISRKIYLFGFYCLFLGMGILFYLVV